MPGDPGLPEKCPAISLDDAGVTEDGGCGVTVRRREQYFMFDREVYRTWSRGTSVWLDGRPDDDSNDSSFQQNDSNCCQRESARGEEGSENASQSDGSTCTGTHMYSRMRERRARARRLPVMIEVPAFSALLSFKQGKPKIAAQNLKTKQFSRR